MTLPAEVLEQMADAAADVLSEVGALKIRERAARELILARLRSAPPPLLASFLADAATARGRK